MHQGCNTRFNAGTQCWSRSGFALMKRVWLADAPCLVRVVSIISPPPGKTLFPCPMSHSMFPSISHPKVPCNAASSAGPSPLPPPRRLAPGLGRATPASLSPTLEMPKSDRRALRYSSRRIFSGLMSPWITCVFGSHRCCCGSDKVAKTIKEQGECECGVCRTRDQAIMYPDLSLSLSPAHLHICILYTSLHVHPPPRLLAPLCE